MSRADAERPRLRDDLVAGPHPEDAARFLVYCLRTGQHFETSADGWRFAEAFDGKKTLAEIAASAPRRWGIEVEVLALERYAARLDRLGALAGPEAPVRRKKPPEDAAQRRMIEVPDDQPLVVHPHARFTCEGFGTCCQSGYVIPLKPEKAALLRQAKLRVLPSDAPDPVTLLPSEPGQPWRLALDNERTCPFLDDERRCLIHDDPAQPDPCRVFPMYFVSTGTAIHTTLTHRCLCGQLDRGELLERQAENLAARLRSSRMIPLVPGRTRLDDVDEVDTRQVVALMREVTLGPVDPWAMLLTTGDRLLALARREVGRRKALPGVEVVERLLSGFEIWEDEAVWAALRSEPHPNRHMIRRDLAAKSAADRQADPVAEIGRFVRDHLFGLRLYEASTIARGLLALGVAVRSIFAGLPKRHAHSAARLGIMLHEDALTSARLRGLYTAKGPLDRRTTELGAVVAQLRVFADER